MAIYPVVLLTANRQVVSTSFKSQIAVLATTGALKRGSIVTYSIGPADVPNGTDCSLEWDISRVTADGTGTTYTTVFIAGLETGTQQAPSATMKIGYTVEPTVTASSSIESGGMNQRGFFRWVAEDKDSEPTYPAVAASGFAFRALSTNYASKLACKLNFRE